MKTLNKSTLVLTIFAILLLFWPEQTSQSEPIKKEVKKEDTALKDILEQSSIVNKRIRTKINIEKTQNIELEKQVKVLALNIKHLKKENIILSKRLDNLNTSIIEEQPIIEENTDTLKVYIKKKILFKKY